MKKNKMKKNIVVVTGVSGQDGSHMVDYLLKNTDFEIYGTFRRVSVGNYRNIKHAFDDSRFHRLTFDLTDPHSIISVVRDLQPAYFINFAAQSFVGSSWDIPKQTFETNAVAVLDILEAIRQFSPETRFYNAGTSEEFGDVQWTPQTEGHPIRPRSPYGAAKAAARHLVKVYRESYGLYAVQGWLFNHEGTRRGEEFVTRKITQGVAEIQQKMLKGEEFKPMKLGNMATRRDWSDAEDFVDGVWRMLNQEKYNKEIQEVYREELGVFDPNVPTPIKKKKKQTEVVWLTKVKEYILASGEDHTIAEFVDVAFEAAGIDGTFVFEDKREDWATVKYRVKGTNVVLVEVSAEFFRPAEVQVLCGDSTKAQKDLGWESKVSFRELVYKMVSNDIQSLIS